MCADLGEEDKPLATSTDWNVEALEISHSALGLTALWSDLQGKAAPLASFFQRSTALGLG